MNNEQISFRVIAAEFEKGIVDPEILNDPKIPELAIVGRSNVGKSSLINRLTNNSKLARVSSTPGRTQQLNSFLLKLKDASNHQIDLRLIDLPGFGYAKLSKVARGELIELINAYLNKSKTPDLVLLLNDSKRPPAEEELEIRNHCFERVIPVLLVLTKCDRLKKNELSAQTKKISQAYGLEPSDVIISGNKISVELIWQRIFMLLE